MFGYSEYAKGYKLFDLSSQKTFIERSVQFKEYLMQEIELAQGKCSHLPDHDDVSDESFSDFYDFDIYDYDDDMHSDHVSPIHPKWDEKTIEAARDVVGDPLDSMKTRSQFYNTYSTCELNIYDSFFMMVGYYPKISYQ